MPTTPNYGWDTPADTDYVTNGALAIRTMANDADATVYSVQTTLDNEKVDRAGDTMSGPLIIQSSAPAARALGIKADGLGASIIQFLNTAATLQTGYIYVALDTSMQFAITSNGNEFTLDDQGNTTRTHNGIDRPIAFATQAGYQTNVPAGSFTTITLASGRFTEIPILFVTANNNGPLPEISIHTGNVTTSSFRIYNTGGAARNVFWQAIQMIETSAAG